VHRSSRDLHRSTPICRDSLTMIALSAVARIEYRDTSDAAMPMCSGETLKIAKCRKPFLRRAVSALRISSLVRDAGVRLPRRALFEAAR